MHGVGNSADAMARSPEACKGHPVSAEGSVVIYHHGRSIDIAISVHRAAQIIGKDRRLECYVERIGLRNRGVYIVPAFTSLREIMASGAGLSSTVGA